MRQKWTQLVSVAETELIEQALQQVVMKVMILRYE